MAKKSATAKAATRRSAPTKSKKGVIKQSKPALAAAQPEDNQQLSGPHKIPNVLRLLRSSLALPLVNRRQFIVIFLLYAVLQIVFASGIGSLDVSELKQVIQETLGESTLFTSVTLYGALLATIGSASSDVAATYQAILFIVFSLIFIFVIRNARANQSITVADAFYKSTSPLIQFMLILSLVIVQFIPLILANFLYTTILASGLASTIIEQVIWWTIVGGLIFWTLYMLVASLMATYIVTLPDMRPLQAFRSARKLVKRRRLLVLRKILFLPLVFIIIAAVIMVPIIIFAAPLTSIVFFLLVSISLPLAHSYFYTLYRSLL